MQNMVGGRILMPLLPMSSDWCRCMAVNHSDAQRQGVPVALYGTPEEF